MRAIKIITASVLAFLLGLGTITFFSGQHKASPGNHTEKQLLSTSQANYNHLLRDEKKHFVNISNLQVGTDAKEILNHHPSIKLIHHNPQDLSHYYEREVTVKFAKEQETDRIEEINTAIKGYLKTRYNSFYVFQSNDMDTVELITYFSRLEGVEYAEPNYILTQNEINLPNDVFYRERYQWNLPMIAAEKGWTKSKGIEDIEIAVVDTGVDLDHPDLKNRLTQGYNAIEDSNNPDDDNGHGTHVAGIIASETNNREGIAGLTWYNRIMPIKVMGKEGYGTTFHIAEGIIWATDHGADVINLSLGNYQPSEVLHEAVKYAFNKNVVLIAAAGNDNTDQPSYPAAYPEVLSVSAVDYDGSRAEFSNYGDYIDVTAPGVHIPSTYIDSNYASLSGTSMAAPHVSGLAGLMLSGNTELSNKEVMRVIKSSAYDIGVRGKDQDFGDGLIHVQNALDNAISYKNPGRRFRDKLTEWFQ